MKEDGKASLPRLPVQSLFLAPRPLRLSLRVRSPKIPGNALLLQEGADPLIKKEGHKPVDAGLDGIEGGNHWA